MRQSGCLLFVLALLTNGIMAAEPAPEYLAPEHFFARQRHAEFLPYARQFLTDHPHDERAPRIAMDRVMVATLVQNQDELKQAKLSLLLDHPLTVPNAYFLKTTSANDLKGLLKDCFHSYLPLNSELLEKYTRAFDACYRMHGPAVVDDEIFAQMAIATREARVAAQCQASIKKADSDAAKLLTIALNPNLDSMQKMQQLQSLRKFKSAAAYQEYLFDNLLTEEERASPRAKAIVVENLLHEKHFVAAVPQLMELSAVTKHPQHIYWLAWSQAATGEPGAARATLAGLVRDHAASPWAKVGARLLPLVENLNANLMDHVDTAEVALAKLVASPPELLELTVSWKAGADLPNRAYASIDLPRDAMEIMAFTDAKTLLAYRAAPEDCRLFVAGDASVSRYGSRGMCPTFSFGANTKNEGGYNYNLNFNTVQQGSGGIMRSVQSLMAMPWLKTRETRELFLTHAVRSGYLPEPVRISEDKIILRWVAPLVDRPELAACELQLDAEQRLTAVISDQGWSARDIRYGARDIVRLKPPAWPSVPVNEVAEFGASDFMRLFGLVMSLMDEKKDAANVAAEKTPVKR